MVSAPRAKRTARLMQGNLACAEGAIAAGVRFFAGYPITPSSEIAESLAEMLPRHGGKFIQMEDEISSMAAVIGASLGGLKAMTATSGPGFSLKQENIGYAAMAEVPCVIVNVQRLGPSTGVATAPAQGDVMQARWGTHGDHPMIVFAPTSVPETYQLTVKAVNTAEMLRTPVILLMDEVVAHLRERVFLPDPGELGLAERPRPTVAPSEYLPYAAGEDGVPRLADFGTGYRYHVTGLFHDETGFPTEKPAKIEAAMKRLHDKVSRRRAEIVLTSEEATADADVIIVAYGSVARSATRAAREARAAGKRVGLLKLLTLWPFPDKEVRRAAETARVLLVPEMNLGQVRLEVERAAAGRAEVVGLNVVNTELIAPDAIFKGLKEVL